MSIQAVAFVLDTDVPEVAAKMLMVCLANAHNQETGLCCPSVSRLADESSMSRRSVQRWLKWLADEGYVEVVERSDNGRQQANEYRINGFYRGAPLNLGVSLVTRGRVTQLTPSGVPLLTPL
jgi:DNA-binding transcriptional ArsR family regulator